MKKFNDFVRYISRAFIFWQVNRYGCQCLSEKHICQGRLSLDRPRAFKLQHSTLVPSQEEKVPSNVCVNRVEVDIFGYLLDSFLRTDLVCVEWSIYCEYCSPQFHLWGHWWSDSDDKYSRATKKQSISWSSNEPGIHHRESYRMPARGLTHTLHDIKFRALISHMIVPWRVSFRKQNMEAGYLYWY